MSHGDLVSRMIFYTALALGSAPRLVRRLSVRVYKAITGEHDFDAASKIGNFMKFSHQIY